MLTPLYSRISRQQLDSPVCSIGGKRMYLWRAVDDEGEVLDVVVQRRRGCCQLNDKRSPEKSA